MKLQRHVPSTILYVDYSQFISTLRWGRSYDNMLSHNVLVFLVVVFQRTLLRFKIFPFHAFLNIKHFFNTQLHAHLCLIHTFIFITSLLHVSVCYINHLQRESPITCTKSLAFYKVVCMLHWLCYRIQNIHLCK